MVKNFILLMLAIFVFGACRNQTKKAAVEISVVTIEPYIGNYVDNAYQNRNEGYDWVSVAVSQLNDSTAHIAVRSRADLKRPTCTFDTDAVLSGPDTLKGSFEGKSILFVFSADSLSIHAENNADEGLLNYFCSGGASLQGSYRKINETLDQNQIDKTIIRKSLTWNTLYFEVALVEKKLSIQTFGLETDNSLIEHEIEGRVSNAEIGDLNLDGFPEVMVYISSNGSGSYGSVIGYSVNKGKSMSQIHFPEVAENPEANSGYMGHDEFAIVEHTFNQRFPIYKPNDTNSKPTGGMRQIQYKLTEGENMRQLVVDKILEY